MRISMMKPVIAAAVAGGLALGVAPAAVADVSVPTEVSSALATFSTDPKGAMSTWVDWAQDQPMKTASSSVEARVNCRIDAAGVSRCTSFDPNPSGKGWKRAGVTYTLANDTTQIFKFKGKWVKNNFGADQNPFTNTERFYSYDYWLPWLTQGVTYDTFVDSNGWLSVQEQNPKVGDDQLPVTMVKVSPDGLQATFLQQYQDGKVAITQNITLTDVPAIQVPNAVKQRL
jgi:hypothetical protein